MYTTLKPKVFVAMSGGVDSSVAAALLKGAGFSVTGVFMKFWLARRSLCFPESERKARQAAEILGIPFYVLNLEKEFKKRVVDYFLREYKSARTPNPCVVCNKEIKFGLLLEKALALGADYIATGHYARKQRAISREQGTKFKLLRAEDKNKDQNYFLWMLNQKKLKHILFPVGDYTKAEVRNLAKRLKLPSSTPESMEICFIQNTINDFLARYIKQKTGQIVDKKGKILGRHQGLTFYTIGQRKGIGLSGGPFWVLGKDLKNNLLIVTKDERDLYKKELICKKVNWISGKAPKFPLKIQAKTRYRSDFAPATIYKFKTDSCKLIFNRLQRAITPGQSVVFYKGRELLGGGIIM